VDGLLQADRRTRHAQRGRSGPYAMPSPTTGVVARPCAPSLRGHLQRLVEFCKNNEPQDIASAYKQHEIEGIKQSVSQVEAWSESKMDKLRHIGQELEWIKFCKRF